MMDDQELICAVREGKLKKVKRIIDSSGLSHLESGGFVLLRDAVENKHTAVAKLLLTKGAKVNSQSSIPTDTPLHFAAKNGDVEIVKMLFERGVRINFKNQEGKTPLHIAIESKKIEIINLLLKRLADSNVKDNNHTTPLYQAVELQYLDAVDLLLKHRADVNLKSKDGSTPFHIACMQNSRQIVERLLQSHTDLRTLLHTAVEQNCIEAVFLILERGVNVNNKREDGMTPLHVCTKQRNKQLIELLLNHGASINSVSSEKGYTPLHIATEEGNEDIVKLFLNRVDIKVDGVSIQKLTPLHLAAKRGHKTVVTLLLQHGAKVDILGEDGKTTLCFAVEGGNLSIVEEVLKYHPDKNIDSNRSSLKTAVLGVGNETKKIIDVLLEYGLIFDDKDAQDSKLLHTAIKKRYLNILDKLLKQGADVNAKDESGSTPLQAAIEQESSKIVEILLNKGADANAKNKDGFPPLHVVVKKKSLEIVALLLNKGADVNAKAKDGTTALHVAIHKKVSEKVSIRKIVLSSSRSKAKRRKCVPEIIESIEILVKFGADVDSRDNKGRTILHFATDDRLLPNIILSCSEYQEIVETLMKFGADIDSQDGRGRTSLHIASERGHMEFIKILLEYGSDINITCGYTHSPIDYAMIGKNSVDMNHFLDYDSDDSNDCCFDFYDHHHYYYFDEDYDSDGDVCPHNRPTHNMEGFREAVSLYEKTADVLKVHLIKMKLADLFVSEKNLRLMKIDYHDKYGKGFETKCKKEISLLRNEKIVNTDISYYDVLTRDMNTLAKYMKNENITKILEGGGYETKFPMYAGILKSQFRKGTMRSRLLKQSNKVFRYFFSDFATLPLTCVEKIFSYLNDKDLRVFIRISDNIKDFGST